MKSSPLDYTFAVGKIRALERFLIKEEVFQEAIESELKEALRLFAEADLYSDELLNIQDSQQLEALLEREAQKVKFLVRDLLLDEPLRGLLELNGRQCLEALLKNYPSGFLKGYLKHFIDMYNIKTFLRLYLLKEPEEKLEALLSCDGFLKKEEFLKLYPQDLAVFLNRLEYVHQDNRVIDYAFFLKEAIEKAEKENTFVALEKAMSSFLIKILEPAKYITFGPEPLLAYYFAKMNEINLIRMIILAKLNKVTTDLIKERLNAVYA